MYAKQTCQLRDQLVLHRLFGGGLGKTEATKRGGTGEGKWHTKRRMKGGRRCVLLLRGGGGGGAPPNLMVQ